MDRAFLIFKVIKMLYDVTATSQGVTRTERIDTATNKLFNPRDTARTVKLRYEAFWALDRYSPKVRVLKVVKVKESVFNMFESARKRYR